MFIETPRFPSNISYGSAGGPSYSTSIVKSKSGRDSVNANWTMPLFTYNIENGIKDWVDLEDVIAFFHVAGGMFGRFRFKDWLDYKTSRGTITPAHNDQSIGVGDGVTTTFQFVKNYVVGSHIRARKISKPVVDTALIGIDGVLQSGGYTVDYTTGTVTFISPPAVGANISWGGEFDVPVRFESDNINASMESWQLGNLNLGLVEVRL